MNKSLAMKIVVGFLLLALTVSGCATPAQDDEITVAFSGAPLLDDFQIQLFEGLKAKADELGVNLIHVENGNDPVKQASDIEDLLAQEIDALLVTAANADAVGPSIEQAAEQGVPVFTIDNAANSDQVLNHSGNDLYCIGFRSMEELAGQIGGSGKILHINGIPGMALVNWNDDGVQAFLAENPGVELVMTGYADWDPAKALSITEDILTTHPDLAGIYVISEVMTGGVVQALAAQGLTDQIKVMSGGFAPESQEWLTNNEISGTFEWSSYTGAQEQMQRIYDYLANGEEPPPFSAWPVTAHPAEGDTFQLDCPIGDWTPQS
jgi:ribose transport system substrate-binding protein